MAHAFTPLSFRFPCLVTASASGALLTIGALLLALAPLQWLVATWLDPSYQSQGILGFLAAAGLFLWSLSSQRMRPSEFNNRLAIGLLIATALLRLIGQVLAVNTIGAVALVVDVYAIALLCGVKDRKRAISPFWLSVCFAFSLPLERLVQRLTGFALQTVSADGACALLKSGFNDVICDGIRIILEGSDVLVDLPCSGARALLLLMLLQFVCACYFRPGLERALTGLLIALVGALIVNVMRISILAIGIAIPDVFFGINVMAQPWHDVIGLATMLIGAVPIILWNRMSPAPAPEMQTANGPRLPDRLVKDNWWLVDERPSAPTKNRTFLVPATGFAIAAFAIINLPTAAIDVAKQNPIIDMPTQVNGVRALPLQLLQAEKAYFTQYGGAAAKASFGENNLLVVRTSAPLRHLHAPEDCLRGLGFNVAYLGTTYDSVPTAVYDATAPSGEIYRIRVSFVADDGTVTANISHAIWHWLQHPGTTWTAIQRIGPAEQAPTDRQAFDRAIIASFDLSPTPSPLRTADLTGVLK